MNTLKKFSLLALILGTLIASSCAHRVGCPGMITKAPHAKVYNS